MSHPGIIAVALAVFVFLVLGGAVWCVELEARRQFREREALRRAAREASE